MEMSKYSLRRRLRQYLVERRDIAPGDSRSIHPGIDGKVPGQTGAAPRAYGLSVAERRRERRPLCFVELIDEQRCEHDDRDVDSRPPQLLAFGNGRHPEPPRVELAQGAG